MIRRTARLRREYLYRKSLEVRLAQSGALLPLLTPRRRRARSA
jgi:hypothetical protein